MVVILYIEMLAILLLGIALIIEIRNRISTEKEIDLLQKLIKAKVEEIKYLRNANSKESDNTTNKED